MGRDFSEQSETRENTCVEVFFYENSSSPSFGSGVANSPYICMKRGTDVVRYVAHLAHSPKLCSLAFSVRDVTTTGRRALIGYDIAHYTHRARVNAVPLIFIKTIQNCGVKWLTQCPF